MKCVREMRLTRRDRGMVALAIVLDIAFHGASDTVVSGADLADRTGMARRTLEPPVVRMAAIASAVRPG